MDGQRGCVRHRDGEGPRRSRQARTQTSERHAQYTLDPRLVRHAGAAEARPVSKEEDMNTRN